jgi:hypothetical protein
MRIELKAAGLDSVRAQLDQLSRGELRRAQAKALNDVGFQIRRDMQRELRSVFDRPTPFIVKSPKVFAATPDDLSVRVAPTMHSEKEWTRGGKVGVDPQDVLQAQEWGGPRRDKKSEVLLRRMGYLPTGYQTVIPAQPYPGSDDGRGNLRGAFVQRLLSYFQMYGEQGFKANMKARARDRFEGARAYSRLGSRKQGVMRDQRFFIAGGRETLQIEGGNRAVMKRRGDGRTSHLSPGIWAVRAGELKPVLLFVRSGSYKPKLSMDAIANQGDRQAYLERRLRYHVRQATEVAS